MIIGIDMGHTISGPNYGAVGILKESEQTRILGNKIIGYLNSLGYTVVNCTLDKALSNTDSLNERVSRANAQKLDLFVSLHFNCSNGKGHGTEVYTYKGRDLTQAKGVLNNICVVGFTNRGIKDGSHLAVIRGTKWPAILIEACFIDSQEDVNLYNSNIDKIAIAIVEGITGEKIYFNKPLKADKNSPIASAMQEQIKLFQGIFNMKQDGVANEALVSKLPELTGVEKRGCVTVMQRILIMKGFLSSGSDTGNIGPACKSAINKFKENIGIPTNTCLIDRQIWRKLLEY